MSKGKDKRGDGLQQIAVQFEQQKRSLYNAQFTISKLQQRLSLRYIICEGSLVQYNNLKGSAMERQSADKEKIQELSLRNTSNEQRLLGLKSNLTNTEVQNRKLAETVRYLQKVVNEERQERVKEREELEKNFKFERDKFQAMLSDYKLYMGEREQREQEIKDLIEAREVEVAKRIREVADKERERVQATERMKEEVNIKIKDMEKDLTSLKKEELDTTTRLTLLQNYQLTTELEYQTKQTEKIVLKNDALERKVKQLQQEMLIKGEVEEELAKRSHISKGVIRRLTMKVGELEQQVRKEEQGQGQAEGGKNGVQITIAYENELNENEKKYTALLAKYESVCAQQYECERREKEKNKVSGQLGQAMCRYYSELVYGEEGRKEGLCVDKLKKTHVGEWTREEVRSVVEILLNLIKPMISRGNLTIPAVQRNVFIKKEGQAERGETENKYNIQEKVLENKLNRILKMPQNSKFKLNRKYKMNFSSREN